MGADPFDAASGDLAVHTGRAASHVTTVPYAVSAGTELNLLGFGLVGGRAGNCDAWVSLMSALATARVPSVGTVHVVFERGGKVLTDHWFHGRADGTGRHGNGIDPTSRADEYGVRVDLDSRPASARMQSVLAEVEARAARKGLDAAPLVPFHNALTVTHRAATSPFDPELVELSTLITNFTDLRSASTDWLTPATEVMRFLRSKRFAMAVDVRSAACVLIAGQLPVACASIAAANSQDRARAFREIITLAAEGLRSGMQDILKNVVAAVMQTWLVNAVDLVSAHLITEANKLRDDALDSPPDPVEFSRRLFQVPPYAVVAKLLCQWGRECQPPPELDEKWSRRQQQAAELGARAGEALCAQHFSWITGGHYYERQLVQAARARGENRAVFRLLREGEFRCMRPRSYRPFLEGTGPPPEVSE
jgi:hypothetical protein